MAANYLHGIETVEVDNGIASIQQVKTAVIGLVGIAPMGDVNVATLVNSPRDAAQFGSQVPGFSIPQSLDAIFKQGAGTVIVVNVFDPVAHTSQVTDEAHTVTAGKLKLSAAPIGDVTIKSSAGEAVTYVKDTDYSIDQFGNFTVLSSAIPDNTALKFSFKKLNGAAITAAVLIGEINSTSGDRSGMKCWDEALNLFGFNPKILITPGYSSLSAVAVELISAASKYRAIAYLDAPYGTTVAQAIAGRGPAGTINFNTSSERAELLYPHLKRYDPATDSNQDFPYSAFKAGVRAATDLADGYWYSDSNREIKGVVGMERAISSSPNDAQSDANLLNEKGITTLFNFQATGIRTWGNRSAAWPSNTTAKNFIVVRRVLDIIADSIEYSAIDFLDKPITTGLIAAIRESVNSFLRVLIARGALVDGQCTYDPAKNPPDQIQLGHLTFDVECAVPTPGERLTLNLTHNINLYKSLA